MSDTEMFQELLSSNPYAIIELYELHLDEDLHGSTDIVRFHAGVNELQFPSAILWQGQPYHAMPIQVDGFEYSGTGQLPRPTVRVSNLLGSISALLISVNEFSTGNDLTGAKFIRIRTLSRFLDPKNFQSQVNPYGTPANEEMPREVYYVDRKSVENRDFVEFELASVFDLAGVRAPKRQVIANVCQWEYRGPECGYTGTNYFDEYDNAQGAVPATNLSATSFGAQLTAGETLNEGDAIVSSNGWYRAIMQSDGNFVVYSKNGTAVWATNTVRGDGSYRAVMQGDGNFVIYNGSSAIWATNTDNTASPSSMSFIDWYPTDIQAGRSGGFGYECIGSSPTASGQSNTQTEVFSLGSRSITVRFEFYSTELPADHFSLEQYAWNGITSATITASSGTFYSGETINLVKTFSSGNPFGRTSSFGTLTQSGPSYLITGVTGNTNNRLNITTGGMLVLYTNTNTQLWTSSYSSSDEPLVFTGTTDPLKDVCGKRISSCKKRFGETAELPFGSFPSVGSFYS